MLNVPALLSVFAALLLASSASAATCADLSAKAQEKLQSLSSLAESLPQRICIEKLNPEFNSARGTSGTVGIVTQLWSEGGDELEERVYRAKRMKLSSSVSRLMMPLDELSRFFRVQNEQVSQSLRFRLVADYNEEHKRILDMEVIVDLMESPIARFSGEVPSGSPRIRTTVRYQSRD